MRGIMNKVTWVLQNRQRRTQLWSPVICKPSLVLDRSHYTTHRIEFLTMLNTDSEIFRPTLAPPDLIASQVTALPSSKKRLKQLLLKAGSFLYTYFCSKHLTMPRSYCTTTNPERQTTNGAVIVFVSVCLSVYLRRCLHGGQTVLQRTAEVLGLSELSYCWWIYLRWRSFDRPLAL